MPKFSIIIDKIDAGNTSSKSAIWDKFNKQQ